MRLPAVRLPDWIKGGLFVLLGMGLGGITLMSVQAQSEDVITACASPGGQLRVVETSDDCRPNESFLQWNVEGPRGPGITDATANTLAPRSEASAALAPIASDPEGDYRLELGIPRGEQGPKGDRGPGITAAEATTLAPGSEAEASLSPITSDPESDQQLLLGIPQGEAGQDGLNCWDLDGDGIADPEENTNGDTVVDVDDCRPEAGAAAELPSVEWFVPQPTFTQIDAEYPTFTELRSVPLPAGNHLVLVSLQAQMSDDVISGIAQNARLQCNIGSTGAGFGDTVFLDLASPVGTFGYPFDGWHEATLYGVFELSAAGNATVECTALDADADVDVQTQAIVALEIGEVNRSFSD